MCGPITSQKYGVFIMNINQHKLNARAARLKAQAVGHAMYQTLCMSKGHGIAGRITAHKMRAVYRDSLHHSYRVQLAKVAL